MSSAIIPGERKPEARGAEAAPLAAPGKKPARKPRAQSRTSLLARGEPMVWLNGGALAVCLCMILGLLLLILRQGLATFWPVSVVEIHTYEGNRYLGEVIREDEYQPEPGALTALPVAERAKAEAALEKNKGWSTRRLLRTDNFDITQTHHHWISDFEIAEEFQPEWALIIERATNDGRFNGLPQAFLIDGKEAATEPAEIWANYNQFHGEVRERVLQREKLKKDDIGAVSRKEEEARLAVRAAEMNQGSESQAYASAKQRLEDVNQWAAKEHARLDAEIAYLDHQNDRFQIRLATVDGAQKVLQLADIVRAYPANQLSLGDKVSIFLSRWWEFLSEDPRNMNTEGGVFPAIWGTVTMTLLMSVMVVPFGVLAALYLREYAKAGAIVSAVRIAINNLAGVPSIVFGVFGLGFFCYIIGASVDHTFYKARLPSPTFGTGGLLWASLTLALLTVPVVIVATEEALSAVPRSMREGSYACGASKWQTIRRIVLPRAMPGILTGMILAMARGAGEVAPLMLVGAVKLAPNLPVDGVFPYVHAQRSFMHLGFHIYDVGFQSQDSESAKPMVFTTTLVLILLIAVLNLAAMLLRARLRKRFLVSQF
jgi:phosphate transport system permease protein